MINISPKEIENEILGVIKVFQFEEDFISKIASIEKKELIDDFAPLLVKDKYCVAKDLDGFGLWSFLCELHHCCFLALEKNLNLYLLVEDENYLVNFANSEFF